MLSAMENNLSATIKDAEGKTKYKILMIFDITTLGYLKFK